MGNVKMHAEYYNILFYYEYQKCKYLLQESENKSIEFHQTLCKDIFTIQPHNQVTEGLCH